METKNTAQTNYDLLNDFFTFNPNDPNTEASTAGANEHNNSVLL